MTKNSNAQPRFSRSFAAMLIVVVAFAVSGFSKATHAAAPGNIVSYQGRLLNSNGVPVSNASLNMQFSLSTDTLGAACVWSNADANCASTANMSVTLTDGLFSVNLGDTGDGFAAIPDSVFADNSAIYLKVVVEGETLLPLKRVVAAPYALNSQTLDGFDSLDFCQADGTGCVAGSTAWETSAFGTYENDDDVIVGTSGDETIDNPAFSLSGDDLFVAGLIGAEGAIVSDTALVAGLSSLTNANLSFDGAGTIESGDGTALRLGADDGVDAGETIELDGVNVQLTPQGAFTLTPSVAVTTAITLTDTDFTNALSIGDNIILGTAAAIDFSEFDVSAVTGSITINDGADLGNVSVEGTILNQTSLSFFGAGGISAGAGTALTLTGGNNGADAGEDVIVVSQDWSVSAAGAVSSNGLTLLNSTAIHWDIFGNEITNPTDNTFSFDGSDVLLTSNFGAGNSNLTLAQNDAGVLTLGSTNTTASTVIRSGTGGIDLGDTAIAKAIDIGGVTASGTDTISIATEGTAADVIAIGNANAATTLALTGGNDWSISATGDATFAGDVAVNGDDLTSDGTLTINSSGLVQLGTDDDFSSTGDITSTLVGTETIAISSSPGIDVTADAMTISFAAAHDDTATNTNYALHIIQTDSGLTPEYGADALLYLENVAPDGPAVGMLIGGGPYGYGIDLSPMTGGVDIRLTNSEKIDNLTDDMITFSGTGGDETDVRFDLDGTMPVIDSPTDASVSIGDNLLVGATSVSGVKAAFSLSGDDIYAAGDIAAQSNMYADTFVAGDASTTFGDGAITATGTALNTNIDVTAGVLTHTVALQVDGNVGVSVSAVGNGAGGVGVRTISVGVSGDADVINVGDANANVGITDAQWSISNLGAASFASLSTTGDFDMGNSLVLNIGNAATDFTAGGGLTLAGAFIANTDADFTVDGTENVTIANATGTGTNNVELLTINMINTDAAANSQNGLVIRNMAASSSTTESLITLDNADALALTAAISITGSGGAITTGIDVSNANIGNAVSVGDNTIFGTAAAIDFSEFDLSGTTGSIVINDGGDAGAITVEGSKWDIDELTFAGGGTIATTGNTTLTLNANVSGAGTIEGSADDSLMLKASNAADDVFLDSPTMTLRATFDSISGPGISVTDRDAVITHDMTAGGGTPASQLAFNLVGGPTIEMTLSDLGDLGVSGGIKAGNTSGLDQFDFTTAVASSDAFAITADSVTTADIMQISADALTSGRGIYVERADGAGSFTGAGLLGLSMLDATSSGKVAIIANSGTGSALFVDQNANTGSTVNSTTGGALHIDNTSNSDYGLTVYTNQAISTSSLAYFYSENVGFDNYVVQIESNATAAASSNGTALHVLQNEVDAPGANSVGTQAVVIDTNFNAGIADTALSEAMLLIREDVDVLGGGTPDTVFRVDADGDVWADGTLGSGAADVAEVYPSTDALTAGEIVAFDPAGTGVLRSVSAYQTNVMGAVSTSPGVLLGVTDSGSGYHIALTGRVPLFVTDENGPIAAGDPIVASSTSGVGMKSTEPGMIVGFALEDYVGTGTGTVSVFVSPQFYTGSVIGTDGTSTQIVDDVELTGSLALRGSSGTGITAAMSLVTDVTDATDYRLSIQNSAGAQVAYVSNEGDLALSGRLYPSDRGAIQTSKYIYYDGSAGMGGDFMRTNASGWATGSYDFAEMFPSTDALEAGELVVFGTNNESVARSTSAGSSQLAGIVSTRPGFLAGDNDANSYPIALAGRVPTKVNLENGPIAIGDPLTSSSADGYAMRAQEAGVIVGYALEPYTGAAGSDDKIVAFVSVGYWNGNPTASLPGTDNQASTIVVTQNASNLTALNMNGNIYMTGNRIVGVSRIAGVSDTWSIDEDGTVLTEGLVQTAIASYQGDVVRTTAVTSPDVQITLTGTATIQNGEATVNFEDASPTFNDVISTVAPIRVIVTPNGPVSLYVAEKNSHGFGVRQMDGVSDGITFDWMVTAYRKDYEPVELLQVDDGSTPVVEPEPVVEEVVVDEEEVVVTEEVASEPATDESIDGEPATDETTTGIPADPVSPEISPSDSLESTSVDPEPAPPVLPADEVLSTGT